MPSPLVLTKEPNPYARLLQVHGPHHCQPACTKKRTPALLPVPCAKFPAAPAFQPAAGHAPSAERPTPAQNSPPPSSPPLLVPVHPTMHGVYMESAAQRMSRKMGRAAIALGSDALQHARDPADKREAHALLRWAHEELGIPGTGGCLAAFLVTGMSGPRGRHGRQRWVSNSARDP